MQKKKIKLCIILCFVLFLILEVILVVLYPKERGKVVIKATQLLKLVFAFRTRRVCRLGHESCPYHGH